MDSVAKTVLFDIPIHDYNLEQFLSTLDLFCKSDGQKTICPLNVDIMNKVYEDPDLKAVIQKADLIHVDGAGVLMGSFLTAQRLCQKLATNEIIYPLFDQFQHKDYRFYFLGGLDSQAQKAADVLRKKYPKCQIVGVHRGHLSPLDTQTVIQDINTLKPHILMVGFGSPIQEFWINQYKSYLDVKVLWSVGAVNSYVAKLVPTAPLWMKRCGLEWVYRLLLEPTRLWRRYIIGNPLFLFRVLKERLHS